jgi:hypothetical protein
MRRSSTTVSGPATVRLRRYGEKLLQNSSDNTQAKGPATIRMAPTVLRLNPEAVTSTAKVKMAPTTSRKMLTPRLTLGGYCPPTGICRVAGMWSPAEACCLRSQHAWIRWPEIRPSPRS